MLHMYVIHVYIIILTCEIYACTFFETRHPPQSWLQVEWWPTCWSRSTLADEPMCTADACPMDFHEVLLYFHLQHFSLWSWRGSPLDGKLQIGAIVELWYFTQELLQLVIVYDICISIRRFCLFYILMYLYLYKHFMRLDANLTYQCCKTFVHTVHEEKAMISMVSSRNDNNGVSSTIEVFGDQRGNVVAHRNVFPHLFYRIGLIGVVWFLFLQWLGMSCLSINAF